VTLPTDEQRICLTLPPGVPLLAPNDPILDAKGGIYFTDPGPRPVVPGRPTYVCYLPAGAKVPLLIDGMVVRPNGLTLTTDGKTLIVDDSIGPTVFAYDCRRMARSRTSGHSCSCTTFPPALSRLLPRLVKGGQWCTRALWDARVHH
jgi:sugar lactone lactonase YvrE